MHLLIDIGNSTIVMALADAQGNITATWRFKTKKDETASFFRYELKQGFRKYAVDTTDIQKVTISSVVPEVNDDISQAITDLTGIVPHFFSIDDAKGIIDICVEAPSQLGNNLPSATVAITPRRLLVPCSAITTTSSSFPLAKT